MSVDMGGVVDTFSVKVDMEECSAQACIAADMGGHVIDYGGFSCGLRRLDLLNLVLLAWIEDLACFLDKSSIYAPE